MKLPKISLKSPLTAEFVPHIFRFRRFAIYPLRILLRLMFRGEPMRIGNLSFSVISDGSYFHDGGAIFGQIPKVEWEE